MRNAPSKGWSEDELDDRSRSYFLVRHVFGTITLLWLIGAALPLAAVSMTIPEGRSDTISALQSEDPTPGPPNLLASKPSQVPVYETRVSGRSQAAGAFLNGITPSSRRNAAPHALVRITAAAPRYCLHCAYLT